MSKTHTGLVLPTPSDHTFSLVFKIEQLKTSVNENLWKRCKKPCGCGHHKTGHLEAMQSAWLLLCISMGEPPALLSPRTPRQNSRPCMMKVCEGASVPFCMWVQYSKTLSEKLPQCHHLWGGLGLHSASGTRTPAFWASSADCLGMIRQRHPDVAAQLVLNLEGHLHWRPPPVQQGPSEESRDLNLHRGKLSHGVRPPPRQPGTWL